MNWIIATLAVGLALAIGAVALSQSTRTANVEVRVWQKVDDDRALYISARPDGGSWRDLGTVPVAMDGVSASGAYRYGDLTLTVAHDAPLTPDVSAELRELRERNAELATQVERLRTENAELRARPTPTPVPSPSPTATPTPMATPEPASTPVVAQPPVVVDQPTEVPSPVHVPGGDGSPSGGTPVPSNGGGAPSRGTGGTPTPNPTASPSPTATVSPSATPSPTATPTATPTASPTATVSLIAQCQALGTWGPEIEYTRHGAYRISGVYVPWRDANGEWSVCGKRATRTELLPRGSSCTTTQGHCGIIQYDSSGTVCLRVLGCTHR